MNQKRLYRSADDRILAGVAGGVAAYFDVDPVIVRIIWFLSVFFTGTLTFWAYLVMIIVVPVEPDEWPAASPWAPGGAPVGGPGTPGAASMGSAPYGYTAAYTPPTDPTTGQPIAGAAAPTDPAAQAEGANPADPTDPNAAQVPPAASWASAQPNQWGTPPPGADWRWQRRADRWQRRQERWEARGRGSGGLMFGLLLIVVGGLLAWHQIDPNIDLGLAWPVGVVILGAVLVASSIRPGKTVVTAGATARFAPNEDPSPGTGEGSSIHSESCRVLGLRHTRHPVAPAPMYEQQAQQPQPRGGRGAGDPQDVPAAPRSGPGRFHGSGPCGSGRRIRPDGHDESDR